MSTNYGVLIESFAERHYIKSFEKKYKGAWATTWIAISAALARFGSLLQTSIAETIVDRTPVRICKTEFRVAGTKESRHASGNRCIVAVHSDTCMVHVLLVYGKTDLRNKNETAQWKQLVKDNYPKYKNLL